MSDASKGLAYRFDIDGLRAIAVLAVVFYHAHIPGFAGGYVGVDVFFVLSGYLISQRIWQARDTGGFSFADFYHRRIRRLFPAMLSTVALSLLAGWVWMTPDRLVSLAQSAMASILSLANVYFYAEAGYWEAASWTKPLLHMWSLAVEEQFYLVWPFIALALARLRGRQGVLIGLGVIGVISLGVTIMATGLDQSAAFYLSPFRIYEFVIGAACVCFDRMSWSTQLRHQIARQALFWGGLAGIALSVVLFHDRMAFPGALALVPTLATAAVILARAPAPFSPVLANPVARYLGLISYSLYLVHWPVLVFTQMALGPLTVMTTGLALGLSLALAALQYHLVETPLRRPPGGWSARTSPGEGLPRTLIAAGVAASCVMASAGWIWGMGGFAGRYADDVQAVAVMTRQSVNLERNQPLRDMCGQDRDVIVCGEIDPQRYNILIVGDSFGVDALNAVAVAAQQANILFAGRQGCPFVLDVTTITHALEYCSTYNEERFARTAELAPQIDLIVYINRLSSSRMEAQLETMTWLAQLERPVAVMGSGPRYRQDVGPLIVQSAGEDVLTTLESYQANPGLPEDVDLAAHAETLGQVHIRRGDLMCPSGPCEPFTPEGELRQWDTSHLTLAGARELGEWMRETYPDLFDPQPQ